MRSSPKIGVAVKRPPAEMVMSIKMASVMIAMPPRMMPADMMAVAMHVMVNGMMAAIMVMSGPRFRRCSDGETD